MFTSRVRTASRFPATPGRSSKRSDCFGSKPVSTHGRTAQVRIGRSADRCHVGHRGLKPWRGRHRALTRRKFAGRDATKIFCEFRRQEPLGKILAICRGALPRREYRHHCRCSLRNLQSVQSTSRPLPVQPRARPRQSGIKADSHSENLPGWSSTSPGIHFFGLRTRLSFLPGHDQCWPSHSKRPSATTLIRMAMGMRYESICFFICEHCRIAWTKSRLARESAFACFKPNTGQRISPSGAP